MFSIESGGILRDFNGKGAGKIGVGCAGEAATVKLPPTCIDAGLLGGAKAVIFMKIGGRRRGRLQLTMDQPDRLSQKAKQ